MTPPKHKDRYCRPPGFRYILLVLAPFITALFLLGWLTQHTSKRTETIAFIALVSTFLIANILVFVHTLRQRVEAETTLKSDHLPCPNCGHALIPSPDTIRCTECGRPIAIELVIDHWKANGIFDHKRAKKFETILHANRAQKIADAQSADDPN
jgi:DNA-directed RNA polymerase subunit RPC12/RpoP